MKLDEAFDVIRNAIEAEKAARKATETAAETRINTDEYLNSRSSLFVLECYLASQTRKI